MKAHDLAKELLNSENVEVMLQDPNSHDGPFIVNAIQLETVEEEDEFPEDFDMPEGFTYILLIN